VVLPVFPLTGALLLPEGRLPLNIFEPRYLAMIEDALGSGRLIGMIQPAPDAAAEFEPAICEVGCAGRIVTFAETDDGRFLVTLHGVARFKVAREVDGQRGYRRVVPDWSPYVSDLDEGKPPMLDRARLLELLGPYLELHNLEFNREILDQASDRVLMLSLAMSCPFKPRDKQALLEAPDMSVRAQTLIALMELAVADASGGSQPFRQ
jgi:Lon protease-like protein